MLLSHGHLTGELGQGHQKTQQGTIQAHLLDKSAKRWQTPARARQRPMGVPPPMSAVGPWPGLGERWHRSTGAEPSWHGGGRVERLGPVAWNTAGSGAFPSGYEGPWLAPPVVCVQCQAFWVSGPRRAAAAKVSVCGHSGCTTAEMLRSAESELVDVARCRGGPWSRDRNQLFRWFWDTPSQIRPRLY